MVIAHCEAIELVARCAAKGATSGRIQKDIPVMNAAFGVLRRFVKGTGRALDRRRFHALRAYGLTIYYNDVASFEEERLHAARRLWAESADGLCTTFRKLRSKPCVLRVKKFGVGAGCGGEIAEVVFIRGPHRSTG